MREALRVTVEEDALALSLARELSGFGAFDVRGNGEGWEITLDGAPTGDLLVRVLDTVRDLLSRTPGRCALVHLDGREYRLEAE